ncbi:MAG: hypothetical protein GY906_05225 [bacterium]|nr:hypothetical protein [bacterium]
MTEPSSCELQEDPAPESQAVRGDQHPPVSHEDDDLIRWMLNLSPAERLEAAQGFVDSVAELQNGRRS